MLRLGYNNAEVKQSHITPMEAVGGEEVQLQLIHDLGTR
jgi:hypothetical protein